MAAENSILLEFLSNNYNLSLSLKAIVIIHHRYV